MIFSLFFYCINRQKKLYNSMNVLEKLNLEFAHKMLYFRLKAAMAK